MIYFKPQYHPLALEALQKLDSENIICTPDEILWLHQEAEKATRLTPSDAPLLDLPIIVGNAWLWPLTLGANAWLDNYARPLWGGHAASRAFPGSERLQILCYAFAMAHSRRPEIFLPLTRPGKIIWRVCYWASGLGVTVRELSAVVDRLLGLDADPVDIPTPAEAARAGSVSVPPAPGYGSIIGMLCHFYGQTPAHWLWQESEEKICSLIERATEYIPGLDRDEQMAKSVALGKFRSVVNHIRAAHKSDSAPVPQPNT